MKENKIQINTQRINLVVLVFCFCIAYYPVMKRLVNSWGKSDEYSHGFLIIPICLYIIWTKRERLSKIEVNPSGIGFWVTIFSLLLYILSHFAQNVTLAAFSMIFSIAGCIVYIYGLKMLKELFFPVFFLFFMIPVPSQIYSMLTIPLQLLVSKISVLSSSFLGLPIFREGNVIHLPERTLQVVQACSGLRSLVSLLTLSVILGYFTLKSNFLRTILFFIGIPIAVFVNIVRVFFIIISLYYLDIDLTSDTVHTYYGIFIFALALIIIFGIRGVLSVWDESVDTE